MDFRESLEFLYGLQRFGIKLGLDNTRTLLERAGTPQKNFLCVHVAGTNGKGSTSAFLATILQEAGVCVGLYTSPHLQSFCERIRINGSSISEADVADLSDQLRPLAANLPITFFEFTTVMALYAFARHHVDIAILETGMGGRLDATNAVDAALSIITPISFDHQQHLGSTLKEIAAEKAGIIKERTPVISALQPEEVMAVLRRRASELQSPLQVAGLDFSVTVDETDSFSYSNQSEGSLQSLRSGLAGAHQPENAALAITAAFTLRRLGYDITERAICQGLTQVKWPGRLEWWGNRRQILLDGAHNAAGAKVLADYLLTMPGRRIHWLVGVKDDKSYTEILDPILPLTASLYAVSPPAVQAIDPDELVSVARQREIPAQAFTSLAEGLQAARAGCQGTDIILVAGSLFLVGAVRELLSLEMDRL